MTTVVLASRRRTLRERGGEGWATLVDDYVEIARDRPEELARILDGNRRRRSR